jgi:hypothetical protein
MPLVIRLIRTIGVSPMASRMVPLIFFTRRLSHAAKLERGELERRPAAAR